MTARCTVTSHFSRTLGITQSVKELKTVSWSDNFHVSQNRSTNYHPSPAVIAPPLSLPVASLKFMRAVDRAPYE